MLLSVEIADAAGFRLDRTTAFQKAQDAKLAGVLFRLVLCVVALLAAYNAMYSVPPYLFSGLLEGSGPIKTKASRISELDRK